MGLLDFFRKKRSLPGEHEPPNFKALAEKTHFTKKEIAVLYERFLDICDHKTGLLQKIPFVQQPELALNPLVDLAYDMECRHFLQLRVMRRREKEDEVQNKLEAMAAAELQSSQEEEDGERRGHKWKEQRGKVKKHHKRRRKRNGEESEKVLQNASVESLGAESIDESLGSFDNQSFDSFDAQHVHSMELSEGSFLLEDGQLLMRDSTSTSGVVNTKTGPVILDDHDRSMEEKDRVEGDDQVNEDKSSGKEDNHNEDEVENDQKAENYDNIIDNDNNGDIESEEIKENISKKESVDQNEGIDDRAKTSGNSNVNISNHNDIKDNQDNKKTSQIVFEESKPPLLPATSTYLRTQHRLEELERKKRNADFPDDGIDFAHFALLLSEFSPKASLSSKASYFFKIIAVNNTGCITKEEYLDYLKRITYGLVPAYLYDDVINDIWDNVCTKLDDEDRDMTRKMFSKFISTIDLNLFMTIPY